MGDRFSRNKSIWKFAAGDRPAGRRPQPAGRRPAGRRPAGRKIIPEFYLTLALARLYFSIDRTTPHQTRSYDYVGKAGHDLWND
jgi:hypothetical protein